MLRTHHTLGKVLHAVFMSQRYKWKKSLSCTILFVFPFYVCRTVCSVQLLIFVRRLIEKGANASGALDFNTALHLAAYLGFGNIAMLLIDHGANTMDVDGSEVGRTPLEVAIQAGSDEHLDYEEVHMYDTCAALLVKHMTPFRYMYIHTHSSCYNFPCYLFHSMFLYLCLKCEENLCLWRQVWQIQTQLSSSAGEKSQTQATSGTHTTNHFWLSCCMTWNWQLWMKNQLYRKTYNISVKYTINGMALLVFIVNIVCRRPSLPCLTQWTKRFKASPTSATSTSRFWRATASEDRRHIRTLTRRPPLVCTS